MSQTELERTGVPEWTLGWRLQRSLAYAGVSVQEMADELDVSRGTISRWCNDHNRPRRSDLRLWALRTGVPLDWLLHGDSRPIGADPLTNADIPSGITGDLDGPITREEILAYRKRVPIRHLADPLIVLLARAAS